MALEAHHHHPHNQTYPACAGGHPSTSSVAPLEAAPVTLQLLRSLVESIPVDLEAPASTPAGWQRCLSLKTGKIFYKRMSRNNGKSPKLDLKLNLSPPPLRGNTSRPVRDGEDSPNGSSSSSSPPSSCVSSCSNSPEATSMVLAGCPRCLMYVMLSEEDPRCPKCKNPVLLDFLQGNNSNSTKKNRKS
ncbi:hypothetical protein J5N97_012165 [Dioscorea zingiberensis]|uniref:GIR1-like zinc ribbon domain-containing protein n=1 Tax=Dioscorea zingiberensis TaxID=325984 RepID=A0A9D5CNM7_9LILI|nr:hypothetical protein J5N97_012165 [Dioscorea zingiberensis]